MKRLSGRDEAIPYLFGYGLSALTLRTPYADGDICSRLTSRLNYGRSNPSKPIPIEAYR